MTNVLSKHIDRFTEADIDSEIVIMRLDSGEFYSLSETAAAIWRLIDGERDRDAVIVAAAREFQTSREVVAEDVGEFLAQLQETGLLAPS